MQGKEPRLISVNKAVLKIDGAEYTKHIGQSDGFVSFETKLARGSFKLENVFYDGDESIMGASYVRVIGK